ncbi:MAG TPA: class I adenylate-forming enzyme family protein [Steroidobacteraceae bacterium]|nr:class I adenylate-forming enzyme family protein [Steroidobacteraceae bacterium]
MLRSELHFGDRLVRTFAERPANFDALLRATAAAHPNAVAFVQDTRRLTYSELDAALSRVAGNLAARGIAAGARVGVLCEASIEFMLATFGALRRGAIPVPIGIRLQAPELDYVIQHCGMEALIFDAALAHLLPAAQRAPGLQHRIAVGSAVAGADAFEQLLKPIDFAPASIEEEDVAMIMYTSGTTGKPKGAMLPHLALVHSAMHFQLCLGHDASTRALLAIPPSHISGLGAVVMPMLRAGGCTVISQGFKAGAFLRQMAAERGTFTVLVPAMYKLCLMEPDFTSHDLSAWRVGIYGGAIMPPATIAELMQKLPHLQVVNGYGATETASPAAVMPLGHTAAQPDSVGKTVACGDIRILDEQGREVPTGESGELWIGGPMVAKGYWNDPQATRESFVGGYWRSGDIGSIDAQGYVRILDRRKDMINRGGYKVFSAEVEGALARHPDIVESVVVPYPDPVLGERVFAFICARRANLSGEEVRSFCRPLIADYKLPELFRIGSEPLLRNQNGKFDKPALRALATQIALAPNRLP